MPKVLRIINRFNLGGPTYNAAYLSKYLAPEFETMLVGGAKDESEGNSEYMAHNLGLNPIIIPEMRRALNPVLDYKAYQKIKKIITEFKPDIVHTHASKAGALGRMAAYNLNVPVILHTFHGHVFDAYFSKFSSSFYKNIERYLAKKSTRIIAISEIQKYDLGHKYSICNDDKIEVIPLGFDLLKFQDNIIEKRELYRNQYKIENDQIAIAIIGRLVPIKNHELFLNAIKYISSKANKNIRVFIVGDGESKDAIKAKAIELNLSFTERMEESNNKLITFTSWIKDVDRVIAGVDVVALTSLNEGTPVSLIEAQAGNKPIVSTNVGGIENVVIPGRTALLSENNDLSGFAENLLKVIEDDDLRKKMSLEGWMHVKEKFHYTRLVEDTQNLYYRLLKQ
jgi:glycosyltransferase involved in cell wall biosynthesis